MNSFTNSMLPSRSLMDSLKRVFAVADPRLAGVGGSDLRNRTLRTTDPQAIMVWNTYIPKTCLFASSIVLFSSIISVGRTKPMPVPMMLVAVSIDVATVLFID